MKFGVISYLLMNKIIEYIDVMFIVVSEKVVLLKIDICVVY